MRGFAEDFCPISAPRKSRYALNPRGSARPGSRAGAATAPRQKCRIPDRLLRAPIGYDGDVQEAAAALKVVEMAASRRVAASDVPAIETDAQKRPMSKHWQELQRHVQRCHGAEILNELGVGATLEPVVPEEVAQKRFLEARRQLQHGLTVTYHGTQARNIKSISRRGLLVPGTGGIRIANGTAHGLGVYTARLGSASLSRGFCDSSALFVCAVCDTSVLPDEEDDEDWQPSSQRFQTRFPKIIAGRTLKQESKHVRHVGDAVVVMDGRCVTPVFLARCGTARSLQDTRTKAIFWHHCALAPKELEQERDLPQQVGRRRLVVPNGGEDCIRAACPGSPSVGDVVWIPRMPLAEATRHMKMVKRRLHRKGWQREKLSEWS